MNDWNIQSRSHECGSCAKPFEDKQPYHTLLLDEKQEYKRLDVCEYCWQTQFSMHARERYDFLSHWQGVYETPPPPEADPIQKENAETLLRKIIERNDPKHVPTAYILAVMLERKRLLKVKEQFRRDDGRVFIYEQPKTGDVFTVLDPELRLDELEEVQRDVAHLLEHGLDGPMPGDSPAIEASAENGETIEQINAEAGSGNDGNDAEGEDEIPSDETTKQTA